jgi:hypothetical protein
LVGKKESLTTFECYSNTKENTTATARSKEHKSKCWVVKVMTAEMNSADGIDTQLSEAEND